jgi:hypothetical protein
MSFKLIVYENYIISEYVPDQQFDHKRLNVMKRKVDPSLELLRKGSKHYL